MISDELIKLGRNSKCLCGSGKKYKKFCLSKGPLKFSSYEITTEPIEKINTEQDVFSKEDYEKFMDFGEKLAYDENISITDAMKFFEALREKYPPQKRLWNLLCICYEELGETKKLEDLIQLIYKTFPDYLFAKTAYVSYWMQKDNYSKFEEVFNKSYDLKSVYPDRDVFHASEAFAFFIVCGRYFGHTGNREVAERYLKMASELDPDHPHLELVNNEILLGQMKKFINSKKFREDFMQF